MDEYEKTRRHPRSQELYEYFMTHEGRTLSGKTREISPFGAGVYSEVSVPEGQIVDLDVMVPGSSLTLKVKATVRSCIENPLNAGDDDAYIIGVEFLESREEGAPLITESEEGMFLAPSHIITVNAPVRRCYELACDFLRYPEWASGLEQVAILEKGTDGRPLKVEFLYNFFIRKANYALEYSYNDDENFLCWSRAGGDDDIKEIGGSFAFKPRGKNNTSVIYEINLMLGFIPSQRLINWGTSVIMRKELKNFKKFAEKNS